MTERHAPPDAFKAANAGTWAFSAVLNVDVLGRPLLADAIDNRPGAVYFRTWMRWRRYTGGLLNHKSGHTFDILNWMLNQRPKAVSAMGGVAAYTPKEWAGEFCSTCRVQEICPEYYDVNEGRLAGLFSAADRQPDTRTDLCVFNSEKDTVDHATVTVEYEGGARASYALCLFAPYSQRPLGVLGTGGKVEGREGEDRVRVSERSGYGPRKEIPVSSPRHFEHLAVAAVADTGGVGGGHGGGDVGLLNDCFAALGGERDPVADLTAGYWSAVLGIAAEEFGGAQRRQAQPGRTRRQSTVAPQARRGISARIAQSPAPGNSGPRTAATLGARSKARKTASCNQTAADTGLGDTVGTRKGSDCKSDASGRPKRAAVGSARIRLGPDFLLDHVRSSSFVG